MRERVVEGGRTESSGGFGEIGPANPRGLLSADKEIKSSAIGIAVDEEYPATQGLGGEGEAGGEG